MQSVRTRRVLGRAGIAALCGSALLAAACGGGGGDDENRPVPQPLTAQAQRIVEDGAPTTRSEVVVRFNRTLPEQLDDDLAAAFTVTFPESPGVPQVTVVDAAVSTATSRLVTLQTDALVPDGAELTVDLEAFGSAEPDEVVMVMSSDLPPLRVALASGALQFNDPAILESRGTPAVSESDRDAAAMREVLNAHLTSRGADEQTVATALNAFDTMPVEIVASPKLRAALAALTGTFAEPAIASLLTEGNCTGAPAGLIAFQPPPDFPELLARVTRDDAGRRVLSLNPIIEGERMELMMPILAHEAIHCDEADGLVEEISATAFDTYLFMLLVALYPELVDGHTALSRDMTIGLAAFINSGRAVPESVGVLQSPGVTVALPGSSSTVTSFAEHVAGAYPGITEFDSPEESTASAYAERLAVLAGIPPGSPFDLDYLDAVMGLSMPPDAVLAAINALGLAPP